MARYDKNRYGVLEDIIATTVLDETDSSQENEQQIFFTYKPKKEIGKEIFKELYKRFNFDPQNGDIGFCMDDSKEVGILSQCQSLQALLLLASDFDLTFDDKHLISEEETNLTIREIMDTVIEDLFARIKTKNKGIYRFDASPYETKLFTVKYSNVEAITWVVPCFLQALKYHAQIGETCKWEKELVDVINYSLKYLNGAFIGKDTDLETNPPKSLTIGWNFTKDCQEPSLYYTFTVCECFVDMFETFKSYLLFREAERKKNNHGIKIPHALEKEFKAQQKKFAEQKAAGDRGFHPETGKKLAQFDEYNELKLRYTEINGGVETIDGSLYGELEENCKKVAKEIWRLSKEKLADAFFYNDLHTVLSDDDIAMATTSDALFNTVYIINILLDAGIDEDILLQIETASNEKDREDAQRDYNNLFDACQLASQKAFRSYEKLKSNGKDYIVEQFLVGFNEKFDTHRELVKELRKRRMRVFTLMPLLIRTNNVISEYLIKYPQHNMRKYLGYILENRYEENKQSKWIWEKDGFFSCSNYYYVSALGEFYSYYEKYESKFIPIQKDNLIQRQNIVEELKVELGKTDGEIGQLNRKLVDKENEISRLNKKINSFSTPVEDAVSGIVHREITKLMPQMLCSFIQNAADGLTASEINKADCANEHTMFANSINSFVFALLSSKILDQVQAKQGAEVVTAEKTLEAYNELSANIKKDFDRCLRAYISEISNHQYGESSWYRDNRKHTTNNDNKND